MNIQRIGAVFEKDVKDFMKNMMLLMMPVITIILALFYSRLGGDERLPFVFNTIIVGITFAGVTAGCIMIMIAEENEKKTLRGLMLSPASFSDIIIGKSLVTGFMTMVTLIASLMIVGMESFLNLRIILGMILLFLFFLFLGIGVGLFSKSVASVNAYLMPVLLFFGMTPMIDAVGLSEDSIVTKIADAFPLPQFIQLHDTNSWLPLGIIAIWGLASFLFTYLCFVQTKTDD